MAASVISIDLGGTKTVIARYALDSLAKETEERIPTNAKEGFSTLIERIIATVEKLRTAETQAVCVGVAGLVRQPEGVLVTTPNIPGGGNFPLKETLEKRLTLRAYVDNDANCFALGEAHMGAGKGHKMVVGLTLGTGVGGGIVVEGKLLRGSHGYAAEIGHMLLMPGHPPYQTEDKRGEVEQFFSGTAMGLRCPQAEQPQDYLEGDVCSFLQPQVFKEVAWLCVNLLYVLDPDIIVFGGSTGYALAPHFSKVEAEMKNWIIKGTPLPKLAKAKLKDAATIGAALLAR